MIQANSPYTEFEPAERMMLATREVNTDDLYHKVPVRAVTSAQAEREVAKDL
jgi:hypothetical protein